MKQKVGSCGFMNLGRYDGILVIWVLVDCVLLLATPFLAERALTNTLSKKLCKKMKTQRLVTLNLRNTALRLMYGAGDGNRTHDISLEG